MAAPCWLRRCVIALAATAGAVLVLLAPARALAARTYHVSAYGSGTACTEAEPCSMGQVQTTVLSSGDVVIVNGGEASYGTPTLPMNVNIHVPPGVTWMGAPGRPMPVIYSQAGASGGVILEGPGSKLADFDIHYSGSYSAVFVDEGTLERVLAQAGTSAEGCNLPFGPLVVIDSVCEGRIGMWSNVGGSASDQLTLRNDTFYGTNGTGAEIVTNGIKFEIAASNSIFHGSSNDIEATIFAGSIDFSLDHSNYSTVANTGGATITAPGSGTNQKAAPIFADPGAGDFREAPGSPTIDAGVETAKNGATDLAGNPRNVSAVPACTEPQAGPPDIGAYEVVPAALPAASCQGRPAASGPPAAQAICRVPKLTGKKLKPTRRKLKKSDCRVGKVALRGGATRKSGRVVKQKPKPGTVLAPGAKVKLTLG
jgi:hypothetical protein